MGDVIWQTLIGALICAATTVWHYGHFESIVSSNDAETKTSDFLQSYKATAGFMYFRHRGYFRVHKDQVQDDYQPPARQEESAESEASEFEQDEKIVEVD